MKAIILVGFQNDFLPGGALEVPHGDELISVANRLTPGFSLVIAVQDWHAADHLSFASQYQGRNAGESIELAGQVQTLWPDHCIENSHGAEFPASLEISTVTNVFRTGMRRDADSYSAFYDSGNQSTGMGEFLKDQRVTDVVIMGLATENCVKNTALDAVRLGFATTVVRDGCRGIDRLPGDSADAIASMRESGVEFVTSRHLLSALTRQA